MHGERRIKHISNSRHPDDMQPQDNAQELETIWKHLSTFLKVGCASPFDILVRLMTT